MRILIRQNAPAFFEGLNRRSPTPIRRPPRCASRGSTATRSRGDKVGPSIAGLLPLVLASTPLSWVTVGHGWRESRRSWPNMTGLASGGSSAASSGVPACSRCPCGSQSARRTRPTRRDEGRPPSASHPTQTAPPHAPRNSAPASGARPLAASVPLSALRCLPRLARRHVLRVPASSRRRITT